MEETQLLVKIITASNSDKINRANYEYTQYEQMFQYN